MRRIFLILWIGVLLCVAGLWAGQYGYGPVVVTQEWQYHIVLRLGAPDRTLSEPGVTLRIPGIETLLVRDKRLQYLAVDPSEMIVGNETLLVDYYAVWQITDPLQFSRSYPSMAAAERVIRARLQSRVNDKISSLPVDAILARANVLGDIAVQSTEALADSGVAVVDLRISRTDIPKQNEESTFNQMREQRLAIAREHRAKGDREAREIRAKADREASLLQAQAQSQSEITRGAGDAEAAGIYASAYSADPDFYAFVRSLEAYRKSVGENTNLVLSPEHEFFEFFKASGASAP
jgi:membrane protease subunit HflC